MRLNNSIKLVRSDGSLYNYSPTGEPLVPARQSSFKTRVAFAAAHVVLDPLKTADPWTHPVIDWESTLAYREYLWSLGFGVAEAMDTAQRGMGLNWPLALELIQRSYRRREGARSRGCKRRGHRSSSVRSATSRCKMSPTRTCSSVKRLKR